MNFNNTPNIWRHFYGKFIFPRKFSNFNNTPNILRDVYGITHLITNETTNKPDHGGLKQKTKNAGVPRGVGGA